MKKTLLILMLLLIAVPVLAFPGEGLIKFLADKTGLTDQVIALIGSAIVLPVLGALTRKIEFAKWEKGVYVTFYNWAQVTNDAILKIPVLGFVWEKWLEPYFIKMLSGLFRIIAQIPMAISAGLNSRGESLVRD